MKSIPTQRTTTRITAPEPAIQTGGVEAILAGGALLVRRLHVAPDDAVADGTLGLALERALDVLLEGQQAVDEGAVAEHDDALDGAQPGLPSLLGDGDAVAGGDERGGERVAGREADAERYRCGFRVDGDGGNGFRGARVDLEAERALFVRVVLRGGAVPF